MASLNLNESPYGDNPSPFAKLYIYAEGSDVFVPIYRDRGLTETLANPVTANEHGIFDLCYLMEGSYRAEVHDRTGRALLHAETVAVRDDAESGIVRRFARVQDLLDCRTLSFTGGSGRQTVLPGDLVHVTSGDFTYSVAAETATDHHIQTAAGVKLYVKEKSGKKPAPPITRVLFICLFLLNAACGQAEGR